MGEADLRPLALPHLGAESPRQELRPEADAEDRHLAAHRLRQPLALVAERRVGLEVVDAHRAAHRDDPVDLVVRRQRVAGERFDLEHLDALAEGVEDPVGALPGRVYEGEQRGHGRGG